MTDAPQSVNPELVNALRHSDGTVTEFLEELAGEPIDAEILVHRVGRADTDNLFGLVPEAELLRRAVVLTGRTTRRAFVYAESTIAVERLPLSVRRRLERSNDPIGRVLLDHHLAIDREPVAGAVVASEPDRETGTLLARAALSRRYLITIGGKPAIMVSEWFLEAVPAALAAPR